MRALTACAATVPAARKRPSNRAVVCAGRVPNAVPSTSVSACWARDEVVNQTEGLVWRTTRR